jgi:hypothetical protein
MLKYLLIICCLFVFVIQGKTQNVPVDSIREAFDKIYGLDIGLINGKKYYPAQIKAKGDPFWGKSDFLTADITLSGKTFRNQILKYNLHQQEFVLLFSDLNGQQFQIVINYSLIDSVRIPTGLFIRNQFPEIKQPFVRNIYQGHLSCYSTLYKKLDFSTIGVNPGYNYSKELESFYLVIGTIVFPFDSRSEFLRIFSEELRPAIRKQISMSKLKFKKIDQLKLRTLVSFCDQKLNSL